jgi:hypothetical protein
LPSVHFKYLWFYICLKCASSLLIFSHILYYTHFFRKSFSKGNYRNMWTSLTLTCLCFHRTLLMSLISESNDFFKLGTEVFRISCSSVTLKLKLPLTGLFSLHFLNRILFHLHIKVSDILVLRLCFMVTGKCSMYGFIY